MTLKISLEEFVDVIDDGNISYCSVSGKRSISRTDAVLDRVDGLSSWVIREWMDKMPFALNVPELFRSDNVYDLLARFLRSASSHDILAVNGLSEVRSDSFLFLLA